MDVSRIIGQYTGSEEGPLLVFIAGIHGNELSGVQAIREVFKVLEQQKPAIKGKLIGLAGNVNGLELEKRYIHLDMNRVWLSEEEDPGNNELNERDEFINAISEIYQNEEEVYFFDLHSTSSESVPFIMISDTIRNREISRIVGIPVMLGLLEHLHGMLIDATSLSGIPTLIFQGGQSGQKETIDHHQALVWKIMAAKSGLDIETIPRAGNSVDLLNRYLETDKNRTFYEISYVHKIGKESDFKMNPGYKNFQTIRKNEVLGLEDSLEVKAKMKGLIFMPLYQSKGREGYYIARPIADKWIRISKRLRLFKYHNKLHWLLGVKKVSKKPLTYRVDQQVTFAWALEVFHLLGYIKIRHDGPFLFMTRREDEINPPLAAEAFQQFISRSYLMNEIKEIESDWVIPFTKSREVNLQ